MSLKNQVFVVDTSLFNDETQLVISLMNQFLGLDTDIYVTQLLISVLFKIITSPVEPQSSRSVFFKYDEFLANSIHSQLVNFHNTRHFIFQSHLVRIFLFFNEGNLEMVLTDEIKINCFKHMKFLMAEVYKVYFQHKLPRVLPIMKEFLQFSPKKRIGY